MMNVTRTQWVELCAEAAICEDPERFQELVEAITAVLHEETQRLETPAVHKMHPAS